VNTQIESSPVTFTLSVSEIDDVPMVQSQTILLEEDSLVGGGMTVQLNMSDAETGQVLDGYVTRLPTKGRLYALDTISGNLTHIDAVHNLFDVRALTRCGFTRTRAGVLHCASPTSVLWQVGSHIVDQYVHEVHAVSSFWGSPPYAGYHALQIIGPPDCDITGECALQLHSVGA
jgi:hypothetical protein